MKLNGLIVNWIHMIKEPVLKTSDVLLATDLEGLKRRVHILERNMHRWKQHGPGTFCKIEFPDGIAYYGHSRLNVTEGDHYVKEKGRAKSLNRAIDAAGLSKEDREKIWADYRARRVKPIPQENEHEE